MTYVSRQDGCLYDLSFKVDWVGILLMFQGRMRGYIPYMSRQDGWMYDLCVKEGWVII